jgi:DNA-binding XRE family transcriptional regulator
MDFIGVRKYLENLKSKIRHASSFNITITKLYISNNGIITGWTRSEHLVNILA